MKRKKNIMIKHQNIMKKEEDIMKRKLKKQRLKKEDFTMN
jgi:uncharacterized protein (DUF3084 family)